MKFCGIPLPVIQRHLGHESIQTTVDRYGHLDRRSSRMVADVVGKALGQATQKTTPWNTTSASDLGWGGRKGTPTNEAGAVKRQTLFAATTATISPRSGSKRHNQRRREKTAS